MGFSPICDPPRFFSKIGLSLLHPYGAQTSWKKIEKTYERSLRYLKTDGPTDEPTDVKGRLLRTPLGKPGVQNLSHDIHIMHNAIVLYLLKKYYQ